MKPTAQASASSPEAYLPANFDIGPYRVEVSRRKLWKGDELVQLSPKAFDLLVLLVAERHRIIDKDELMRRLWPDTVVGEESVTQSISALRRALGDDPANPQYIATIPRRGYQFIGAVSEQGQPEEAAKPTAAESPDIAAAEPPLEPAAPARVRLFRSIGVGWAILVVVAVATALLTAVAVSIIRRPAPPAPPIRFSQEPPVGTSIVSGGTLSPNGRLLAFLAKDDAAGTISLWIRDLNSTQPRRLAGTEGAMRPFWAPNSDALGFFSQGQLRTVAVGDGTLRTLAVVGPLPLGGTWGSRNTIIFGGRRSGLTAVSLDTGEQRPVTTLDREHGESGHRLPQFLPDGDHFIYSVANADPEQGGTYLSSLSGATPLRVLPSAAEGAIYADPGFLLYVTEQRLVAHPFDTTRGQVRGQPVTLATGVDAPLVTNAATISASATGLLSYGGGVPRVRLIWYDDRGTRLNAIDGPVELHNPVISPDGTVVLASQVFSARRGVWAIDTRGGGSRVVTDGTRPFPSPDGRQVAYTTDASGVLDLRVRDIGGTTESTLVASPYAKTINHWTADGRYIVFVTSDPKTMEDLWLLPMFGDRQPMPFLQTQDNELQGEVSPDGRWIAYTSDESGTWEVYVQRFPSGGFKRAISVNGGFEPHWRRTGAGNRLFYLASTQTVMAVDFAGDQVGAPQKLFHVALANDQPTLFRNLFAVTADGTRFLIDSNDGPGSPVTVLVNWPTLVSSR